MGRTDLRFVVKCIYAVLICQLITSHGYSQSTATIKGVFNGTKEIKAFLKKDYESTPSSNINGGKFVFNVAVKEPSYYEFAIGDISTEIYVEPGDQFNINIEGTDPKLTFSGDHARDNEFIQMRDEKRSNVYQPILVKIRKCPQEVFLKSLDSVINGMKQDLKQFEIKNKLSSKFAQLEFINYDFIAANQTSIYIGNYARLHNNTPPLEPRLSDFIKTLNYNDPRFIPSPRFQDFVRNQTYNSTDDLLTAKPELRDSTNNNVVAQFMAMERLFTNPAVRDYAMYAMLKYDLRNYGLNVPKTIVKEFLTNCHQPDYKKNISDNYRIWSELAPGLPAPTFSLPNEKGIIYSLGKFKGKYLYIDVWATWCAPCLEEMPALKKLESRFADRLSDIMFVKISIDLNKTAWLNKTKSMADSGFINLHAQDGANSSFAKSYAIKDIPRYIIIDKSGKIINASAPEPSSALTESLIKDLIK